MKIIDAIKIRGVTQREVALWCGINPSPFNLYVNGKRKPSLKNLLKILEYFDGLVGPNDV